MCIKVLDKCLLLDCICYSTLIYRVLGAAGVAGDSTLSPGAHFNVTVDARKHCLHARVGIQNTTFVRIRSTHTYFGYVYINVKNYVKLN